MPHSHTMRRERLVAMSMSPFAPFVISLNTISSAARPPIVMASLPMRYSRDRLCFSSTGSW